MTFPTHIVAAAGFVENDKDQVLMVKVHNAKWVFPGGQVEIGESIPDAVKREVLEESGIECEVLELVSVISNTGSYTSKSGVFVSTKVMFDFVCKHTGGTLGISDETTDSGWFSKDEALALITSQSYKDRFMNYLKFKKRVNYIEYKTKPSYNIINKRYI